jgi:hypothetical protein
VQIKPITVKEIDRKRFKALTGESRSPAASYVSEELGWYANEDETIIAVLLNDTVDNDFAAIIMARDEGDRFCAFDVEASFATKDAASAWLVNALKWHTGMGLRIYPQGHKTKGPDLFTPIAPSEDLNATFILLANDESFLPARRMIKEMMPHFIDIDGNFVEQFQKHGFDARLWELYLYGYLCEEELFLDRKFHAPDFVVKKYGKSVGIEAVIAGRKDNNAPKYLKLPFQSKTADEILEAHKNELPIIFGSPLFSKLQKKYWELPHMKGHPLVLAIADFHDDRAMLWSSTALPNYLYGVRFEWHHDEKGKLVISSQKVDVHQLGSKQIPSGFFFQPDAEKISGILFSASGTISKFNRIGRQAGFYEPTITMIRVGTCYDHDANASLPKKFSYVVDENCNETWAEGLSMYHNPNATDPVPEELFPSIAHHHFKDGMIVSRLPEFHPFASLTLNLKARRSKS